MAALRAVIPVLYLCRRYEPGDILPTSDAGMVAAWVEAGSARWDDGEGGTPASAPKAIPITAEPGRPGKSSDGDPEALAGKPPRRSSKRSKA